MTARPKSFWPEVSLVAAVLLVLILLMFASGCCAGGTCRQREARKAAHWPVAVSEKEPPCSD
jgi:hypothetical protein